MSLTVRYLDYFHVMTYDFHGSWDGKTGENSPLYKSPVDTGDLIYFNVVSTLCDSFPQITDKNFKNRPSNLQNLAQA